MKKFLSVFLTVAMLIASVSMTASAFDTITIPTEVGESILLEMEDYNEFSITNQTYKGTVEEMEGLSGGKGVFSGSTSMYLTTLTLPISVDKDTIFDMEMVAGCSGAFHKNYWCLDDAVLFYTTSDLGTLLTNANGEQIYFSKSNKHYPAGKYVQTLAIPAGDHKLTFNIPARGSETGAFALDYVKLTATDKVLPEVSYAEGATASAKANGNVAAVTFTDGGIETLDGVATPVAKYQIEIVPADSTKKEPVVTYTFDTNLTGQEARPSEFTAHFSVPQTLCGTFVAKVYPTGNTYPTQRGEAAVSNVFTIKDTAPGYASRYEAENYWDYEINDIIVSSKYASGEKMILSTQNDNWVEKGTHITRTSDAWQDVYEVSFDVNLPKDGTYDVETVMGKGDGEWTDKVEVFLDNSETPVYTNTADEMNEILSINGYYPYVHIYAGRYNKDVELSAGQHNVKFVITAPRQTAQPHLFMVDYIQFTPDTISVSQKNGHVFEMEDYTGSFYAFDENGNTESTNPDVVLSGNASGGAAITRDYTPGLGRVPVKAEINFTVKEAGFYLFESVDSTGGCDGFVTVNNGTETKTVIDKFSNGTKLHSTGEDGFQENRPNWHKYFNVKWHGARRTKQLSYLDAGDYTMTVQFDKRDSASAVAFFIDYVKIMPFVQETTNISKEGVTIELDTMKEYFMQDNAIPYAASIENNQYSTGGMGITTTEIPMKTGHSVEIPVNVEKAGWYSLESVMSRRNSGGWTSAINISVDGDVILVNEEANSVEDLSRPYEEDGETKFAYINVNYPMHRFAENIYLEEGDHTILFHALPRTQKVPAEKEADEKQIAAGGTANPYRVCYHADYIALKPVTDNITVTDKTVDGQVVYETPVSGKLIVAAYADKQLVGSSIVDAENQLLAGINLVCEAAPDTVKVMVWNDMSAFAPVAELKTFTFGAE